MVKQNIIIGVIILVLVIGGIYFVSSKNKQSSSTDSSSGEVSGGTTGDSSGSSVASISGDAKVITIDASRWRYSPETITVKKGDKVKIVINNKDTKHGIAIPDFGVSGVESVEFTADKTGTFGFKCPTFCGEGHIGMKGTLIVE